MKEDKMDNDTFFAKLEQLHTEKEIEDLLKECPVSSEYLKYGKPYNEKQNVSYASKGCQQIEIILNSDEYFNNIETTAIKNFEIGE